MTTVPAPDPPSRPINLEIAGGIAHVTLQRPPLNVLDLETLSRLNDVLRQCATEAVRVVLIRSDVPRAFSAGVDVRDHAAAQLGAMLAEVRENARLLLGLEAITVAAIHGLTLGGGAELALLCDVVIAGDDLSYGFPEIGLGAFPPIAAALLSEQCAPTVGMPLLLGDRINAERASQLGLVSSIVPVDRLAEAAASIVDRYAAYSRIGLYALLRATRGRRARTILRRVDAAIATYRAIVGPSRDGQEGIDAFLEKRAAVWSHR